MRFYPVPSGCSAGVSDPFFYAIPSQVWLTEWFEDSGHSKRERGWFPCAHYKCVWDPNSLSSLGGSYSQTDQWSSTLLPCDQWFGHHSDAFWAWYYAGSPGIFQPWLKDPLLAPDGSIPLPADVDILRQRSISYMMPNIKDELSSINSLIELKDLPSLKRTAGKALAAVRSIAMILQLGANLAKPLLSLAVSYATRQTVRSAADAYLQLKFNIQPLLSDIDAVKRSMAKTAERMNKLISLAERPRTAHWSQSLKDVSDGVDEEYHVIGPGSNQYYPYCRSSSRVHTRFTKRVFHAEMLYSYSYSHFQHEYARVLAFLDALGVNFSPKVIWNAIPWSFVVDWVLGVNQFLDQLTIENMKPAIAIERYLYSISTERRLDCSCRSGFYPKYFETQYQLLPTVVESSYRRDVLTPKEAWFGTTDLSLQEMILGAALKLSRLRSFRRRSRKRWKSLPEPRFRK